MDKEYFETISKLSPKTAAGVEKFLAKHLAPLLKELEFDDSDCDLIWDEAREHLSKLLLKESLALWRVPLKRMKELEYLAELRKFDAVKSMLI